MTTIRSPHVLEEGHLVGPRTVTIVGDRITAVSEDAPADLDLGTGVLTPGLMDLQNNGSFGADFADATPQQWGRALAGLAARGVTAVQPTIITAPLAELNQAFSRAEAARSAAAGTSTCRFLGVHLEGPFISEAQKGAHRAQYMLDPTEEALDVLLSHRATRRTLLTVTLAPERDHALDAIRRLVGEGIVVSVGHSDASAEQVWAAADAGATMTTHVFNAQRPFRHRDPGVPGAVMTDERYFIGTIIDGQHVDPAAVRIVFAAARGRVIGVTDAIATAGLPNRTPLAFGGQPVENDDLGLGRRANGTIAGAGIVLDEGIRRMVAAGMDPATVLASCTEVAARSLNRTDIGRIAPGALADLVWWDDHWFPRRVWLGGLEVEVADQGQPPSGR